jgi:hypothetical protein
MGRTSLRARRPGGGTQRQGGRSRRDRLGVEGRRFRSRQPDSVLAGQRRAPDVEAGFFCAVELKLEPKSPVDGPGRARKLRRNSRRSPTADSYECRSGRGVHRCGAVGAQRGGPDGSARWRVDIGGSNGRSIARRLPGSP